MIFLWCDCVPFLLFTWIFGTYLHTYIYTYIHTYLLTYIRFYRLNLSRFHWNHTGECEASLNMLTPNSSPNSGSVISFMYTKTLLWPYSSAFFVWPTGLHNNSKNYLVAMGGYYLLLWAVDIHILIYTHIRMSLISCRKCLWPTGSTKCSAHVAKKKMEKGVLLDLQVFPKKVEFLDFVMQWFVQQIERISKLGLSQGMTALLVS